MKEIPKQIKIKDSVINVFFEQYSEDLVDVKTGVKYDPSTSQVQVILEGKTTTVVVYFSWNATKTEFDSALTSTVANAVAQYKREIAHQDYLETILQKRI